jgi:cytochrome P450
MALPPGPSQPAWVQTARWLARPFQFMDACRREYGDVFTMRFPSSRSLVFLSDPPLIKAVLADDRHHLASASRDIALRHVMGPQALFLLDGDEHRSTRRLMTPAFHARRVEAYTDLIQAVTERDIEGWPDGRPFRIHDRMYEITMEVILRAVFGIEEPRRAALRDLLVELVAPREGLSRALGFGAHIIGRRPLSKKFRRTLDGVDALLLREIEERRSDPRLGEREDILSLLASARYEDGGEMSPRQLRDQLMTLVLAGHMTIAVALAWSMDLLFSNPAAAARLSADIQAGDESYLEAVVQETLRVRPVIPALDRRLGADLNVNGLALPAGTEVAICIYLLNTRQQTHANPHHFAPERFLNGGPDSSSWLPFGGGTRRCLGAAFAQLEMKVVLRTVIERVVLRPAGRSPQRPARDGVMMVPKQGTPAIVERRL